MPRGIPKDKSVKKNILKRYKIVRGHIDKVIRMVEEDEYCIDIIHQSLAVQAALKKTDRVVLQNHMKTCVAESIREGKEKEVIGEVMKVVEKL
jgi:DNA-binding FrmR family transcriptional regulator